MVGLFKDDTVSNKKKVMAYETIQNRNNEVKNQQK